MPITSGVIEYERRLNLGEYNHKHVVAKILWTVEPGEDDDVLAAFAIDKVVMRIKDVLNWKPAVPDDAHEAAQDARHRFLDDFASEPKLENKAAPNLAAQHPAAEITAGIPPALKRPRRTKAEMLAARIATAANPNHLKTPEAARAAADDPDIKSNRHGEPILPMEVLVEPGMPSFDPDPEPPAEVTDQALLDACQAKASSGKPVADIKELVAKFSPGGLVQTPPEARRRFLDDLAKL